MRPPRRSRSRHRPLTYFYEHENSNIQSRSPELAARSTDAYEGARNKVARFINAPSAEEIVSCAERRGGSTSLRQRSGPKHINEGTRSLSRISSTTRTSCPGSSWRLPRGPSFAWLRLTTAVKYCSKSWARSSTRRPSSWPLLRSRTRLARFDGRQANRRDGASRGCNCADRRSAVRLSHEGRCAAAGRDFFVFSGHKVFARPASALSGARGNPRQPAAPINRAATCPGCHLSSGASFIRRLNGSKRVTGKHR